MKINQNPIASNIESAAIPEMETQSAVQPPATSQGSELQEVSKARQLALDTRSVTNVNANLMQASLLNQVPTRTQILQNASQSLKPALPQMLSKSGNDPDRFMSTIREELKPSVNPTYKKLGSLADGDIMAIAFIVLMEASKSAQEDLKAIMDGVKGINQQKEAMRDMMEKANAAAAKTADDDD